MSSSKSHIVASLFAGSGKWGPLGNVKFFLGTSRSVTGTQLLDQLARADAQVESGVAQRTTKLDGDLTVTTFGD